MPTFDASDAQILALGLLAPTAQDTIAKVHNLLLNWAWQLFCQCVSAPTPPLPIVAPPPGTSQPTGNAVQPCFIGQYRGTPPVVALGTPNGGNRDVTAAVLPTDGRTRPYSDSTGSFTLHGIPAGATRVNATGQLSHWTTGSLQNVYPPPIDVFYHDASGVFITTSSLPNGIAAQTQPLFSSTFAIPANASYWYAQASVVENDSTTLSGPMQVDTQVYCGGAPGGYEQCCPPDPAITLALTTIINLLQNQSGAANPPVSWSDGVRHSSLREAGSLTINPQAIGVRLEVTSPPVGAPILPGDPTFYWDMGFITPMALTSPLRGWRLVFLTQSFQLPEFTDQIGYTLLNGTVADLVELMPVYAAAQ